MENFWSCPPVNFMAYSDIGRANISRPKFHSNSPVCARISESGTGPDLAPKSPRIATQGATVPTKQTQSTWFVRIWTCNIEIIAHPFDNVNGLSKICSRNNSAWTNGILDSCAVFRIATWRQPSAWQPKRNPDETHRARRGSLTQCGCLWSFAVWRSVALSA